ncbi:MAG: GerMN domain-containing protein [Lachnospiraceae bacterium]|nr:GerMN domain-containing protein [Lachnospiraceae bacterium]
MTNRSVKIISDNNMFLVGNAMGNIKNYSLIILFAVLLCATVFASSCQEEDTVSDNKNYKEEIASVTGDAPATKLAYIYNVNLDTFEKESVAVMLAAGSKMTPDTIMNYLITCFTEKSLDVKVNKTYYEDANLVVDFSKASEILNSDNSELETAILDAIGQSLIDNLENIEGVIFRIEGEAYVNHGFSLGLNEVYISK